MNFINRKAEALNFRFSIKNADDKNADDFIIGEY